MKKNMMLVLALVLSFASTMADAADNNRTKKRFGIHLGLLGDPFPTLIGGNLNYNLTSFARLTAGYGTISATGTVDPTTGTTSELKATTYGGGLRFLVPSMNFSPIVGISYANVDVTATGLQSGTKVGGFSGSDSHFYITGGLDWQAANGFNFGLGYNYSLLSGVGGLPYINFGWYF